MRRYLELHLDLIETTERELAPARGSSQRVVVAAD
jgi:hypothetical protein